MTAFSKEGDEKKEEPYLFDDSETIKLGKDVDVYKSKNSAIIVLLVSFIFLVPGFLPVIRSTIRMSCIAFSILLFAVFLILLLKKGKIKEYSKKTEEKEVNTIPKIDIGTAETIFFDSFENEECLKLQWKERGRNKQFILKDLPCTVGKMKEETNLCISDISISRIHCRFVEQENRICIMDLNSTNGTFLNGLPVKNGEVLEIEKNDEILEYKAYRDEIMHDIESVEDMKSEDMIKVEAFKKEENGLQVKSQDFFEKIKKFFKMLFEKL